MATPLGKLLENIGHGLEVLELHAGFKLMFHLAFLLWLLMLRGMRTSLVNVVHTAAPQGWDQCDLFAQIKQRIGGGSLGLGTQAVAGVDDLHRVKERIGIGSKRFRHSFAHDREQ